MQFLIMIAIAVWIIALELATPKLSDFAARKLCHAGCGAGMMLLDPTQLAARVFVWCVAASSIAMTWGLSPLPPFRFSRPRDIGVTAYLTLVSGWFALQLPPTILAPVFFADPAGAVFGKFCSRRLGRWNPAWFQQKTVCGSLAVFGLTLASVGVGYPCSTARRLAVSAAAALAEAVGGDFDNLALAAVVLLGWAWSSP